MRAVLLTWAWTTRTSREKRSTAFSAAAAARLPRPAPHAARDWGLPTCRRQGGCGRSPRAPRPAAAQASRPLWGPVIGAAPVSELRRQDSRMGAGRSMTYSLLVSLLLVFIGVVLWIEGGPTPRTRAAWLLLAAILIVSALPMLMCWLFR